MTPPCDRSSCKTGLTAQEVVRGEADKRRGRLAVLRRLQRRGQSQCREFSLLLSIRSIRYSPVLVTTVTMMPRTSTANNAYRTTNPAYFHIEAANLLGNVKVWIAIGVRADTEVWNQPVHGFKVYSTRKLPWHSGPRVETEADDPTEPVDPEAEAESEPAADFFRCMLTFT
ncbi:hypothetical protein PHYPSEUDO_011436 [Phytophthora pseudosyringae]|uniref:Uncharacterized protein n=1 Tax=Phytophthora pseudosyringae TaxID=221518 RepID=A0A8T1WA70_9STRA|nr:hypothetical protein PHYPSEUDO_011436 [Phytophthora pseudosyringae]